MIYTTAVIGGGPAGMMAAIQASQNGTTIIIEKNPKLGKKLLLTGKGRCNLTTTKDTNEIVQAFGKNGKFLYGPLSRFSNQNTISFFEKAGVTLITERGGRVFPESNNAETVIQALLTKIKENKVSLALRHQVKEIQRIRNSSPEDPRFISKFTDKTDIQAQNVVIATGGNTYPNTGSTGDGYDLAKSLGHTITPITPALVPLITESSEIRSLAGLSLKNVTIKFYQNDESKPFISKFGEMLFTHTGISGPIVLDCSKDVAKALIKQSEIRASIDLKPALNLQKLTNRINREINQTPKVEYATLLKRLLPMSLIQAAINRTQIDRHTKIGSLTKEQKSTLIEFLKNFSLQVDNTAPLEFGIITSGGVNLKEIDPRTMESKLVPGLYFAGEVIDLDGPTGGFNLQEAWTTGYVAGMNSEKIT